MFSKHSIGGIILRAFVLVVIVLVSMGFEGYGIAFWAAFVGIIVLGCQLWSASEPCPQCGKRFTKSQMGAKHSSAAGSLGIPKYYSYYKCSNCDADRGVEEVKGWSSPNELY
ncbi:MAG: hypothetical protein ACWGQW_14610 [bacterium]